MLRSAPRRPGFLHTLCRRGIRREQVRQRHVQSPFACVVQWIPRRHAPAANGFGVAKHFGVAKQSSAAACDSVCHFVARAARSRPIATSKPPSKPSHPVDKAGRSGVGAVAAFTASASDGAVAVTVERVSVAAHGTVMVGNSGRPSRGALVRTRQELIATHTRFPKRDIGSRA
jgi:hypothetical protein